MSYDEHDRALHNIVIYFAITFQCINKLCLSTRNFCRHTFVHISRRAIWVRFPTLTLPRPQGSVSDYSKVLTFELLHIHVEHKYRDETRFETNPDLYTGLYLGYVCFALHGLLCKSAAGMCIGVLLLPPWPWIFTGVKVFEYVWYVVLREGNDPDDYSRLTYRKLLEETCRFANVLKSKGVSKGDRVVIYMPMILELPIAMLACTRIGAVHSVVVSKVSRRRN